MPATTVNTEPLSIWRTLRDLLARWRHGAPLDDWEHHFCLFEVTLINGAKADGDLMRRKMGTEWVYRRETPEEEMERLQGEAL